MQQISPSWCWSFNKAIEKFCYPDFRFSDKIAVVVYTLLGTHISAEISLLTPLSRIAYKILFWGGGAISRMTYVCICAAAMRIF